MVDYYPVIGYNIIRNKERGKQNYKNNYKKDSKIDLTCWKHTDKFKCKNSYYSAKKL